jgi:hypothetical protein
VGIVSDACRPQTGQVSVETDFNASMVASALRCGRISSVRCRVDERGNSCLGIVIGDGCGLVLERDHHMADAGNRRETRPHNVRAGRAGHVFNRKRHRFFGGKGTVLNRKKAEAAPNSSFVMRLSPIVM